MSKTARVDRIKAIVKSYYDRPNNVINWNQWIFKEHNEAVAKWVRKISKNYQFNIEAVEIAAYLHDIAYAWTDKNDPIYEKQSEDKAGEILESEGFSKQDIELIVNKIIAGHSMYSGKDSDLLEAKVFSTADALAHFTTDFYLVMCWNRYLFENKSLEDYKKWVSKKIERDFNNKIYFEDFKKIARPYYESIKRLFSV